MSAAELTDLSILELSKQLSERALSSEEATRACLQQIEKLDPKVKAFLLVDAEGALAAARASDERRRSGGAAGVLDGVPVALKDIMLTEGVETTGECAKPFVVTLLNIEPQNFTYLAREETNTRASIHACRCFMYCLSALQ